MIVEAIEMFEELLNDTISLRKKNGDCFYPIKASVQRNKIFIDRSDILIETGDLITRKMSNSGEETYEVIDPVFHENFHGIPAHYQIDVKKLGVPQAKEAIQNITYNISGKITRFNQNSVDLSTNTVNVKQELINHVNDLRAEVKRLELSKEVVELVNAIEGQVYSEDPSKSVVSSLINSLPKLGNIASICSLIIAALG